MVKNFLLVCFQQSFQCFQVIIEGFSAGHGGSVGSLWFSPDEYFPQLHVTFAFQHFHVAGEVAIRQAEHLFEGAELHPIVHHQHGHDAQPDAVVEFGVVELVEEMLHPGDYDGLLGSCVVGFPTGIPGYPKIEGGQRHEINKEVNKGVTG